MSSIISSVDEKASNEVVTNILAGFIGVGFIVIYSSIRNVLWGYYWVLFTLYLIMFHVFSYQNEGVYIVLSPILIVSILITWKIQLFRQNFDRVLDDTYNKNRENGKRLIPDEFYTVNALVTVLFMFKAILIVMMLRYSAGKNSSMATNIMVGVIGISILNFMLLLIMHIIVTFYITDG